MAATIPIDRESSQTRFHAMILLYNVSRFSYCIVICSWSFSKTMRNENSANVHPSNRRKARSYPHTYSQLQQGKTMQKKELVVGSTYKNKLTVNGTKSSFRFSGSFRFSESFRLGGSFRFRGYSDIGGHSDFGGSFRFKGLFTFRGAIQGDHSDFQWAVSADTHSPHTHTHRSRSCCGGQMSVCFGYQNNTLWIRSTQTFLRREKLTYFERSSLNTRSKHLALCRKNVKNDKGKNSIPEPKVYMIWRIRKGLMELITTTHSLTDMEKHDLEIYKITSASLLTLHRFYASSVGICMNSILMNFF